MQKGIVNKRGRRGKPDVANHRVFPGHDPPEIEEVSGLWRHCLLMKEISPVVYNCAVRSP